MPKARRGEVWSLLADRAGLSGLEERFPALASDYDGLKSQLPSHQHAILIDLGNFTEILFRFLNLLSGRTFPSHGYFSGALGPGQCGLFNLLKVIISIMAIIIIIIIPAEGLQHPGPGGGLLPGPALLCRHAADV